MVCSNCNTKYYSRTNCPKCGTEAFALNKGRRAPSNADYSYIYRITIAFFIISVLMAVIFLQSSVKKHTKNGSEDVQYKKYPLVKVTEKLKNETKPVSIVVNNVTPGAIDPKLQRLNDLGVKAYNESDYDAALDYFLQVHEADNSNDTTKRNIVNALIAMGGKSLQDGSYERAISDFNKALEYNEYDFGAYKGIGVAYFNLGDKKKGLSNLLTAYDLNQNDDNLNMTIAKVYADMLDYENAKKFLNFVSRDLKNNKEREMLLATIEKQLADLEGKDEAETPHFKVFYDGYDDPVAGRLVSVILEEAYFKIGRQLGYYPPQKLSAILYTNEEFKQDIDIPTWVGAIFDGKIKLPSGGLKDRSKKLEEALSHEFTHAVIFSKTGGKCPTWLNEGLAQILSGVPLPDRKTISIVVKSRNLPSIARLQGDFMNMTDDDAYVAYLISRLFTQHMIDASGMNAINKYLDRLAKGDGYEAGFKKAFYSDLNETYTAFISQLKSKYN